MSLRDVTSPVDRSSHPIAVELAVIVAVVAGLSVWSRLARRTGRLFEFDLPLVSSWVLWRIPDTDWIFLGGVVLFAAVYTDYRGIRRGLQLPTRNDLPLVVAAGATPVALAGVTKLVGDLTGVAYRSLTGTVVRAGLPLETVLELTAFQLLPSVPILVVVCQLLIQGSFGQVADDATAIVLTTVVAGFLLSYPGSITVVREAGVVSAVLFVGLLGWGRYASSRLPTDRRRLFAYLPLAVFVVGTVLSGIAEIGSVAEGLLDALHLTTFGIAAYSYDRTDSLVPPAIAYTSLALVNWGIVLVFEAQMLP